MSNLKNVNQIFSTTGKIDKKKKLNRSKIVVSKEILSKIDNGITSEDLSLLLHKDLPIFKYGGQITIHGLFPKLENNYAFGYKHVFQNKNQSIGIKYGAIDEAKRKALRLPLSHLKFQYSKNSTEHNFNIQRASDTQEQFDKNVAELKELASKIDTKLFTGGVQIYHGTIWGRVYTFLELTINTIAQKNIEPFLTNLGITKEIRENLQLKADQQTQERQESWDKMKAETNRKKADLKAQILELNKTLPYTKETPIEGNIYLQLIQDFSYNVKYNLIQLTPIGRKKYQRYYSKSFNTLNEALENIDTVFENFSSYNEKTAKKGFNPLFLIKKQ